MSTAGFYKNDNGILLFGPNFVLNRDYELRKETHFDMTDPVDGWMYYPDEETARTILGIPKVDPPDIDIII